jgi:hypothetical protein
MVKIKILRHKWIPQDGFCIDKCEHCGCIRKWDPYYKKLVYYVSGIHLHLFRPPCKRTAHCDKITKNK